MSNHFMFHICDFAFAISAKVVAQIWNFDGEEDRENGLFSAAKLLSLNVPQERHCIVFKPQIANCDGKSIENRVMLAIPAIEDEVIFAADFWRELPIISKIKRSQFLDAAAFYKEDVIFRINPESIGKSLSDLSIESGAK
ncbi:hypothetical protein FACS189487_02250 [Campylobacterota bacterium]|nr:hypothetical protein FACS189487_02250 [Campylobacterota bacterium]